MDLEWHDNSIKETGFTIERSSNGSGYSIVGTVQAGVTSFTDNTVTKDMKYRYRVCANGSSGKPVYSNEVEWITLPNTPSNVTVSYFPGTSMVTVKWQDNSSNEEKFRIEKAHSNQGGIIVKEVAANTIQFEDEVWVDHLHMYRIAAVSADGTLSPYSKVYNWYAPPRYPDGVKAAALSGSEVQLTWNDRSAYETSFKITRKGDNMVVPIEVAANTTTYTDKGLKANTVYSYTICAYNSTSNTYSEYYPEVNVTTLN